MIKVGVVGFGTIGKRAADAVKLQKDMELVGVTVNSYNYRIVQANALKIPIYALDHGECTDNGTKNLCKENGIQINGDINDLCKVCDIIIDCSPKPHGKKNREKYYEKHKVKAIFQGGEKADGSECSFNANTNYADAIGKDYVRVVSCNTTGLARTLKVLDDMYTIKEARATLIRRAADPWDSKKGPINAIKPVLKLPSHHGPDVKTVMKDLEIITTAVAVPSTLMHMHTVSAKLEKEPNVKDVIAAFKRTPRIRLVRASEKVDSTAQIMEIARDLGTKRADMIDICVWEEGIGIYNKDELFYMQAIHQESDVVPDNIDCIRAMMGEKDAEKSMELTNKSLGL